MTRELFLETYPIFSLAKSISREGSLKTVVTRRGLVTS